jgi:hypothetical protein
MTEYPPRFYILLDSGENYISVECRGRFETCPYQRRILKTPESSILFASAFFLLGLGLGQIAAALLLLVYFKPF